MTAISLTIWNSDHTWFVEAPTRPSFRRAFPLKLNRSNESSGRSKQKSGCCSFARLSLNRRKIEYLSFYFLSIVRNVSLTRMDYSSSFFFCGSYRNPRIHFFQNFSFYSGKIFFFFKYFVGIGRVPPRSRMMNWVLGIAQTSISSWLGGVCCVLVGGA